MKIRLMQLVWVMIIGGCSTLEVQTDYSPTVKFSELRSYAWLDTSSEKFEGLPIIVSQLDVRIKTVVDDALAGKGYVQVSETEADMLISYHVTTKDKTSVIYTDRYYGYNTGWVRQGSYYDPMQEPVVYDYKEGSLILDVVESKKKNLIWRGVATDELNFSRSPEQRQAKIKEAVEKMLDDFPPD